MSESDSEIVAPPAARVDGDDDPTVDLRQPSEPPRDVILAVDIGGTKFAAGLVTARGELIDRARVEVERDVVPEAHYMSLAGMITDLMDRARDQHHARIRAVGVGAAGFDPALIKERVFFAGVDGFDGGFPALVGGGIEDGEQDGFFNFAVEQRVVIGAGGDLDRDGKRA